LKGYRQNKGVVYAKQQKRKPALKCEGLKTVTSKKAHKKK